jgi:flagellar FliL protein
MSGIEVERIMATTPTVVQANSAEPTKLPVFSLVIAVVLGVILSVALVGGAGYYLIHSGKLRLQTAPPAAATQVASVKTRAVVLEPLVVNLADGAGAYLRVSIVLNVTGVEGAPAKDEKKAEETKAGNDANAAIRDTTLAVLGRQTSESLLTPEGKERLKKELKQAFAERNAEIKVADLYFTEFLVQR